MNIDRLIDTYVPAVAIGAGATCGLVAIAIALAAKRRTGRWPDELTHFDGETPRQSARRLLWIGMWVAWLVLPLELATLPALRVPLAFSVPGVDIALVVSMVSFQLSVVWNRDFSMRLAAALIGRMVIIAALGFFLWINRGEVISGLRPLAVWLVAVVEACLLLPFAAWFLRWMGQQMQNADATRIPRRE